MPLFIKERLWFDYKDLGFSSHEPIGHLPLAQLKFIQRRVRRPFGSRNHYKWVTERTLSGIWVFASRLEEHT